MTALEVFEQFKLLSFEDQQQVRNLLDDNVDYSEGLPEPAQYCYVHKSARSIASGGIRQQQLRTIRCRAISTTNNGYHYF